MDFVRYPCLMMICERCGENLAFAALCNECEWRVLTGTATFTVADIDAMWVELHAELIVEMCAGL